MGQDPLLHEETLSAISTPALDHTALSGLHPEYLSAGTSVAMLLTEHVVFVVVVHFSELLTARAVILTQPVC